MEKYSRKSYIVQRIISFLLSFVMVITITFVKPQKVKAVDPVSLAVWITVGLDLASSALNFWRSISESADPAQAYSDYVSGIQSDLGSSILGNGAVIIPLPLDNIGAYGGTNITINSHTYGIHFSFAGSGSKNEYPGSTFTGFNMKFPCSVNDVFFHGSTTNAAFWHGSINTTYSYSKGDWFSSPTIRFILQAYGNFSVSGSLYVSLSPTAGVSSLTTRDVSVSSRPTVLTGSYRNADNTIYENQTVVDEANLTYTNPVTGQTYPVSSWTYDYATRTYTLTLTDGTTATICYGDDCLTMTDHGNTYTLYYYVAPAAPVDTSGQTVITPGDASCKHDYTSTVTSEPTCTTKGVTTYTCTKCGRSYTEPIDALGHDWQATDTVPTTYALPEGACCPNCKSTSFTSVLNGSKDDYTCICSSCSTEFHLTPVVTYGHTTYTCSRCGATKEETEDPDSGLFSALGNFLARGIDWINDKLVQLINSFSGIFEVFKGYLETIKDLSGTFPSFLAAAFGCMPEQIMTVFWFSIVVVIAVLVWKKWFS